MSAPPPWTERLAELRELSATEPNRAGQETLRLFEDWLYENAQHLGYRKAHGGMREYIDFITRRGRMAKDEAARAARYADVRNCLAHRAGLLMSPALTEELLDFVESLIRRGAWDAEQLMTPRPRTVREGDNLRQARDWMLREGVSRLPVMRDGRVVGLLTNRDLLTMQARHPDPTQVERMTVADAMSADGLEKIHFVPRRAPYDAVLAHLQGANVAALFVTASGQPEEPLLGIISVSDILPKL